MRKLFTILVTAALATAVGGCSFVYKPDVQQGNLLKKDNVDQLKPGMTKRQVLVLLGTPSVTTPFKQDRWDYLASHQHRGGKTKVKALTLYFKNDALVRTEGDFFNESSSELLKEGRTYPNISPEEKRAEKKKKQSGGG